ncbi:biopolymer transporter ExbB [Moellerella wisconsensis]|uniref:biopolymer transporter ExbB n=1 Tax=Moellerella wisconsensis TaxID=158849 RepID=UPI00240F4462|nr:biopolymer transporter ExbB [Moellerella wisconsensis]
MDKFLKITSAILLFAAPYVVTTPLYFLFKNYLTPELSFALHREALGAAISSYSGTLVAVLIAALTFLLGVRNNNFSKLQRYGYMLSIVTFYALTFVELGALFFVGILLISNLNQLPLPSISMVIAITSFLHLCLLTIQLINLSNKK